MWRNKKSMITSIMHFQKILDVLWPENSLTSFYEYSYYWFIIIITSLWWTFFKTQTFDSTGTIWTTGIIRKTGITRTTGMTRMTGTTKTTGLTKTNQDNRDNWDNWKDRDDWDHWNNWDNLDNQDNQDTHNWDIWDNWEDYYSKCINNSGGGSSKVVRLHLWCVLLFDSHNGGVRKTIKILFCQATTLNRDAGYEVLVIHWNVLFRD